MPQETNPVGCVELRGYELRSQDILAASGSIAVKDSYASMHDDMELVSQVYLIQRTTI
jgi:hypothetical protein